jgi:hypothetical protein
VAFAEEERRADNAETLGSSRRHIDGFHNAATIVRSLDPATLNEPREVGRKKLPSTVGGLLTHIAEHTQRHVGEAIITARILKHS